MGMFDGITNFFSGGQQQGYQDMEKAIREGMGQMQGYTNQANALINPYYQAGTGQINPYMANYGRMLDPNHFYNDMMKGYEMSPAAKMQQEKGTDSAMNAASASGMLGSTSLLNNVNDMSQKIMRGDQQNYFNNMMNTWNQGLGHQQGMLGMGYGAGNQMGNNFMNLGRGVMDAYNGIGQSQMGQDKASAQGWGNLLNFGSMLF